MGQIQSHTLKIVNTTYFYLPLDKLLTIDYPEIVGHKLIHKVKHNSGSGGWIDKGEFFYTYDWEVTLSDNTTILYHNQKDTMDMVRDSFIYRDKINERAFISFLQKYQSK